ncbi:MAG: hypothetical protein U9Q99_00280 [Nanoarchaeota archaeon]|nr:hypothetical protein [Nanoarchaeota archaeon]
MTKNKFPVFAVLVLIFAIIWLLESLGLFSLDLPWLPVILIVTAVGWIFNRFR